MSSAEGMPDHKKGKTADTCISCYFIGKSYWKELYRIVSIFRETSVKKMAKKTFLYFAFGSNLLTERIQINNPSAVFRDIAKLRDHKLDFNYFSQVIFPPDMYVWTSN